MASYNLYDKETKTLTQIAGTSVGVAKFGSKQSGEIWGKTSSSPWKAPIGGIYVRKFGDRVSLNQRIIDKTDNVNYTAYFDGNGSDQKTVLTIPIIQGHEYYDNSDNWGSHEDVFYPFIENVVQPIEGGIEYSTEETVIGTYLGKTHYARIFVISDTSLDGEVSLDINGLQAGLNVTSISGTFKAIDAKYTFPVPYCLIDDSESGGIVWYRLYTYYDTTTGNVIFNAKSNQPKYYHGNYVLQLTVEYTKD